MKSSGNERTPAEELVALFQQRFQRAPTAYPSQKELDQANTLITRHGVDRARHIVEYSVHAAQKTKYEPSTFGGILQYTAAALAHYNEAKAREASDRAISACEACNGAGILSFRKPDGEIFSTHCPHDLEKIRARVTREGLTRM